MLLVQFRANLRLQHFSRVRSRSCSLICRSSREHPLLNFCTRSLPIIFIWPYHAMGAISRNFDTPTFFEHGRARSFAVAPGYTPLGIFAHGRIQYYLFGLMMLQAWFYAIPRLQFFFLRVLALINLPLLPGALIWEFLCAITSKITYLA